VALDLERRWDQHLILQIIVIDVGYAIKFVEEFTDPLTISHNNGDSSREDGQW